MLTTKSSSDEWMKGTSSLALSECWSHIEDTVNKIDVNKKAVVSKNASNSMYVIYTSGSTGNPKGVVLQHRGLTNRLLSMAKLLGKKNKTISDSEVADVAAPLIGSQPEYYSADFVEHRILQKTSVSFDVSVWELFLSLVTGACMVLLEPQQEKDPHAILDTINAQSISMLHFVPTMLNMFIGSARDKIPEKCTSLDYVVTSGEALDVSAASGIQVCNHTRSLFLRFFAGSCSLCECSQLLRTY